MRRIGVAVLIGLAGVQAAQAQCPQALAVYADPDRSVSLEFPPNGGERTRTSNVFRVAMENGIVLEGVVIWNNGLARPNGIMLHGCPEGDATGEEIDACTVWEGVVYAVDGSGEVGYMPAENEAAAEQLLFPDFGRAVRYSAVWGEGRVGTVPGDVLRLSGCQE